MNRYSIGVSEEWHIDPIARNMRQEDVNEIWAAAGVTAKQALEISFLSGRGRTGFVDDRPVAMYGVSEGGLIWLLGTPEIEEHRRPFLQYSRDVMADYQSYYATLHNYVDARNKRSIRWLRWLGFEIDPPAPYGLFGMDFHRFHWEA